MFFPKFFLQKQLQTKKKVSELGKHRPRQSIKLQRKAEHPNTATVFTGEPGCAILEKQAHRACYPPLSPRGS